MKENVTTVMTDNELVNRVRQIQAMQTREERNYVIPKVKNIWSFYSDINSIESGSRHLHTKRKLISEWKFRVVDHFKLSREVVAYSLSYYDRFIAVQNPELLTSRLLSLLSLTTLFLACKIHTKDHITVETFVEISENKFTVRDIEVMERIILSELSWNLHPPTCRCFIQLIVGCLQSLTISSLEKNNILSRANRIADLAMCEQFFVNVKASTMALASIHVAVEGRNFSLHSGKDLKNYLDKISGEFNTYNDGITTKDVQAKLHELVTIKWLIDH